MEGHTSAGLDGVRRTASGHGVQTDDALAARLPLSPRKLKGGVHQWVAILRKHDSGTGTRLGRR